ncbi:MAG: rane protein [Mycobacterium sp.]|nr:rane protein [Mycobacterium sp.]
MGWLYHVMPVYTFSAVLGVLELTSAVLLAVKPIAPRVSMVGSLIAVLLFVSSKTFRFWVFHSGHW